MQSEAADKYIKQYDQIKNNKKMVLIDRQKRKRGYYDGTSSKELNQLIRCKKKKKNEK